MHHLAGNSYTRDILTPETKIKKCHRNVTRPWVTPASFFFCFKKPLTLRPNVSGSEACLPTPSLGTLQWNLTLLPTPTVRVGLSVLWTHVSPFCLVTEVWTWSLGWRWAGEVLGRRGQQMSWWAGQGKIWWALSAQLGSWDFTLRARSSCWWVPNRRRSWPHLYFRKTPLWNDITSRICIQITLDQGFPGSANGKEPACQCRRHKRHPGSIPGLERSSE